MKPIVTATIGIAFLLIAPAAMAQREWRKSDGPYKGLQCRADETVVTIPDGVKCQTLPRCRPGQALSVGPDGFQCGVGMPSGQSVVVPQAPDRGSVSPGQKYYAYAVVPAVDGRGRSVIDHKTGKPGEEGICVVWQEGWEHFSPYIPFEHLRVTRWYTGWGFRINIDRRTATATIDSFSAPMVQDTPKGRRRVGPDESVPDLSVTVPLSTSPPRGCTERWIAVWKEHHDLLAMPLLPQRPRYVHPPGAVAPAEYDDPYCYQQQIRLERMWTANPCFPRLNP